MLSSAVLVWCEGEFNTWWGWRVGMVHMLQCAKRVGSITT
jgi:hypothetical protein